MTTSPIILGASADGKEFPIDLQALVAGRLLFMASSGGGKSWALRRLLEQTFGLIQHIVIDPEGDFSTLAEQYGHVVLDHRQLGRPHSLACKVREHRISVILNVSEMDRIDQAVAVTEFVNGLLSVTREHWHPALVAVDEVQLFAPFGDAELDGEIRRECVSAMTQLMSRGRKRGLAGVLATQRLAKMAKSVASEVQNVMLGRCLLDIDIARAADMLGWRRKRAEAMRDLAPGQFLAFGPALAPQPILVKIGAVQTRHMGATPVLTPPPVMEGTAALQLIAQEIEPLDEEAAQDVSERVLENESSSSKEAAHLGKRGRPRGDSWTEEELAVLQECWLTRNPVQMALERLPGRTSGGIKNKASQLKLKMPPLWTDEMENSLRAIFADPGDRTLEQIAAEFGVTVGALRHKAGTLHLSLADVWPEAHVAELHRAAAEGKEFLKDVAQRLGHSYGAATHKASRLKLTFRVPAGSGRARDQAARRGNARRHTMRETILEILGASPKPLRPSQIWRAAGGRNGSSTLLILLSAGEVDQSSIDGKTHYSLPQTTDRKEPSAPSIAAVQPIQKMTTETPVVSNSLEATMSAVRAMLSAGKRVNGSILAKETGISQPVASARLRQLVSQGDLVVQGGGASIRFVLAGPQIENMAPLDENSEDQPPAIAEMNDRQDADAAEMPGDAERTTEETPGNIPKAPSNFLRGTWSGDRNARLRSYAEQGLDFEKIAEAFGHVTVQQVKDQFHRLCLMKLWQAARMPAQDDLPAAAAQTRPVFAEDRLQAPSSEQDEEVALADIETVVSWCRANGGKVILNPAGGVLADGKPVLKISELVAVVNERRRKYFLPVFKLSRKVPVVDGARLGF